MQVALGRLALEPLAIVAALAASNGKEVLSLNLHPMQSHVPEADLVKEVERSIMTVVAQVSLYSKYLVLALQQSFQESSEHLQLYCTTTSIGTQAPLLPIHPVRVDLRLPSTGSQNEARLRLSPERWLPVCNFVYACA